MIFPFHGLQFNSPTCMTICLADLPLILISSCCFKVLYTCSPCIRGIR